MTFNAPDNLTATINNDSRATLSWSDNTTFETGFEVEMSTDGVYYATVITTGPNISTAFIDTSFLTTQVYTFRVRAVSKNNKSGYAQSEPQVLVFPSPGNFVVSSMTRNQVMLQLHTPCRPLRQ
jgi:hypothetical protein